VKTHVNPQRNFTTTLPDSFLRELDRTAKELRIQKNELLMQAFISWSKRRKQALLAESYKRVKNKDREDLIRLADEGLEEWNEHIPA
jgi:hypothetical protein